MSAEPDVDDFDLDDDTFMPAWLTPPGAQPYVVVIDTDPMSGETTVMLKARAMAAGIRIRREDAEGEHGPELIEAGTASVTRYVKRELVRRLGLEEPTMRSLRSKLYRAAKELPEPDRHAVMVFLDDVVTS